LLEYQQDHHKQAFEQFLKGLQSHLNPSISQADAVEMLAQHMITKPVFDALFEGYAFTLHNPVSTAMQTMLDLLEEQAFEKETQTLEKFYNSVKERAKGIDNAAGKQKIIIELYDKFFKSAFPRMAERLGIVSVHDKNHPDSKRFLKTTKCSNVLNESTVFCSLS
jgi:predicted helicase